MNRFSMAAAGSALLAISTETTNNDTKSLALHRSKGGRQPLALHLSKGGRPVITEGVTTKKMYFYRPTSTKENLKFNQNIAIFAAPNSQCLGTDTSNAVGVDLSKVKIAAYADGETSVKIEDSVRGKDCYYICSTTSNTSIIETLLTISTMRRASAKSITAVLPFYGYQRQDRKIKREPIAAADVALMLETMGVDSVICMDLHNDALRGFFSNTVPIEHINPGPVAACYFTEILEAEENGTATPTDIICVAPHEGQVARAVGFKSCIEKLTKVNIPMAFISKRPQSNTSTTAGSTEGEFSLVGDVKGKRCIVCDDIVDSGTTLLNVVRTLKANGAKRVYAYVTHGVFSDPQVAKALEEEEGLEFLLVTNSILPKEKGWDSKKIRTLSVAPLLAEAILRHSQKQSLADMLIFSEE